MVGMLKFVNVSPDLSVPVFVMDSGFTAGCTPGVEFPNDPRLLSGRLGQFDENTAHLLDVLAVADDVFVSQEVAETQSTGFLLRLAARVKRAEFGAQLFGRIACHPKNLFVCHRLSRCQGLRVEPNDPSSPDKEQLKGREANAKCLWHNVLLDNGPCSLCWGRNLLQPYPRFGSQHCDPALIPEKVAATSSEAACSLRR
jgi:hypothetical protein